MCPPALGCSSSVVGKYSFTRNTQEISFSEIHEDIQQLHCWSKDTFQRDINHWSWQQLSLTLWFVFNRSSHPFLMRRRSHTPKSSSDAEGMTDGNDAHKPAIHTSKWHTHTYLSEREYFFMCWFHMSVHSQSYSRNISPQPKQCQDRNAGSTPHHWQEKGKKYSEDIQGFFVFNRSLNKS